MNIFLYFRAGKTEKDEQDYTGFQVHKRECSKYGVRNSSMALLYHIFLIQDTSSFHGFSCLFLWVYGKVCLIPACQALCTCSPVPSSVPWLFFSQWQLSTGYEIVRVKDVLTQVIWTQYFLKEQEYKIRENIFYQNNQSIIKLENNGRLSSRKRPCHINIRYYLITDMIKSQEEYVEFCLTLDMIRDYFKNALQGYWFFLYHNITLGIVEDETLSYNESVRVLI